MDIKLGTKKDKPSNIKFKDSTTNSKKFRINGLTILETHKPNLEPHFINKYYGQKITEEEITSHLAFFRTWCISR